MKIESLQKNFFVICSENGRDTLVPFFFCPPVNAGGVFYGENRVQDRGIDIKYIKCMSKPSVSQALSQTSSQQASQSLAKGKRNDFSDNSVSRQSELGKKGALVKAQKKAEAQMLDRAVNYFSTHETITQTGLALALGFSCRADLLHAVNDTENPMQPTLKRIFAKIEEHYEELIEKGRNPVAIIFALKNIGWTDSQTVHAENKTEVNIVVESVIADSIKKIADKEINGSKA